MLKTFKYGGLFLVLMVDLTIAATKYRPDVSTIDICGDETAELSCHGSKVVAITQTYIMVSRTCGVAGTKVSPKIFWTTVQKKCSFRSSCSYKLNEIAEMEQRMLDATESNYTKIAYLQVKYICVSETEPGPECVYKGDVHAVGYLGTHALTEEGPCEDWKTVSIADVLTNRDPRGESPQVLNTANNYCRTSTSNGIMVCPRLDKGITKLTKCTAPPECEVDGKWGSWSKMSTCSVTCGQGRRVQNRACDSPATTLGGKTCPGGNTQEESCNTNVTCPRDGGWGLWTAWSKCSASCDFGIRKRNRVCSDPIPKYGGKDCPGSKTEATPCTPGSCKDILAATTDVTEWKISDFFQRYGVWVGVVGAALVIIIVIGLVCYCKNRQRIRIATSEEMAKKASVESIHYKQEVLRKCVTAAECSKYPDKPTMRYAMSMYEDACQRSTQIKMDEKLMTRAKEIIDTREEATDQLIQDHDLLKLNVTNANHAMDEEEITKSLELYKAFVERHAEKGFQLNKELVQESEFVLFASNRKAALLKAIESRNIKHIAKVVVNVERSGASRWLQKELEVAKNVQKSIQRVDKLQTELLDIDTEEIKKIAEDDEPSHQVHDVMVAVLLLLGESETTTEYDWSACQAIMSDGFQERLLQFKFRYLHPDIAARAIEILEHVSQSALEAESSAAVCLYVWTLGACEEAIKLSFTEPWPAIGERQEELLSSITHQMAIDEENERARKELRAAEKSSRSIKRDPSSGRDFYLTGTSSECDSPEAKEASRPQLSTVPEK